MNIGQSIRIIASGTFHGQRGTVAKLAPTKRHSPNYIGVALPEHPWSKNDLSIIWWFHVREVESV